MIYTHVPIRCVRTKAFPFLERAWVVADSRAELYRFAAALGMRPTWARQGADRRTYFAVSRAVYLRMVRRGAEILPLDEIVTALRTPDEQPIRQPQLPTENVPRETEA